MSFLQRNYMMSALPPKADIDQHGCDVCFVPKADIVNLIKHLVGAGSAGAAKERPTGSLRRWWQEARSAPYTDCLGQYRLHVTGQRQIDLRRGSRQQGRRTSRRQTSQDALQSGRRARRCRVV